MSEDNTKLVIILEAQARKMQNQLVAVSRQIDRFAAQTERRFEQMNAKNAASFDKLGMSIRNSLGGLNNVLAPVIGAIGIREVINYADAWTEAENKIAAAAATSGQFARPLTEIKDAANGARTELATYVDLYARLLRISPAIAASEADVARATDIVAKSLKAGGASVQEQEAALIQLGQALGSGILQGDELRSLRENAPLVAKAIADEFGVSIGELKKLGEEGKLVSIRVFKALLNNADDIEKAYDATKSTIGDAFTRIRNEFTAYIGTAGEANGATQGLIDALNYLAANFADTANIVVQFATLLAGALAGKAIAGVVVSLGQAVAALGVFITALRTGTLAAGGLSAALGPIGLLAGLAAAAIFTLYQDQQSAIRSAELHTKAIEDNKAALELARDGTADFRDRIKETIAAQLAAAEAAALQARAQIKTNLAYLQYAQILQSNPILGGFGVAAGAAIQSMLATNLTALADNETFVTQLKTQFDEINKTMTTPPGAGGGGGVTPPGDAALIKKFEEAKKAAKERTKALEAETAAQASLNPLVEDYGYAVDKAKVAADLLAAADAAKVADAPGVRAAIDTIAEGYAQAAAKNRQLEEAQQKTLDSARGWADTSRNALRGFIDDLVAGKSAAEALGNVLNKLGDKLIDLGLNSIFGSGGKDFGILGTLFGLPGRASGGPVTAGKPYVVGEKRPELFVPNSSGRIVPHLDSIPMPTATGTGGVNVTYAPVIDARGADPSAVARLEIALARDRANFDTKVVKVMTGVKNGRWKP